MPIEDEIAEAVIKKYKSISKPSTEFQILSGIVRLDTLECIALGTGLKCIPESKKVNGYQVFDSHAEIIAIRNFKRYLMHQRNLGAFEREYALYVSQAFCGDVSMNALDAEQSEADRIVNRKRKFNHDGYARGRMDYEYRGVRTKPGRLDCESSLSMSCSDKILKYTCIGLGMPEKLCFKRFVVQDYFDSWSFEDLFKRVEGFEYDEFKFEKPIVSGTLTRFSNSRSVLLSQNVELFNSNVSTSWNLVDGLQIIVNGYKQGAGKKFNIKNSPFISKYNIALLAKQSYGYDDEEYSKLKDRNVQYQKAKAELYTKYLKGWIVSRIDFKI